MKNLSNFCFFIFLLISGLAETQETEYEPSSEFVTAGSDPERQTKKTEVKKSKKPSTPTV